MDVDSILFLAWCLGIHCLLFAMMDASTRNALIYCVNCARIKMKGGVNRGSQRDS